MLILPLIDLLVVAGTFLLMVGSILKVVEVAMRTSAAVMGFSSTDFVLMTGVCWGFALVLAARSWVKLNEPNLAALRRYQIQAAARRDAGMLGERLDAANGTAAGPEADEGLPNAAAGGERR